MRLDGTEATNKQVELEASFTECGTPGLAFLLLSDQFLEETAMPQVSSEEQETSSQRCALYPQPEAP